MGALRLNGSGHQWRSGGICKVLEDGHDYDPVQVRELFAKAGVFAIERKLPFDPEFDYAQAYIDSCDRPGIEPAVPDHVRQYCASLGTLTLIADDGPPPDSIVAKAKLAKKPPSHPAKPKKGHRGEPHYRAPIAARR